MHLQAEWATPGDFARVFQCPAFGAVDGEYAIGYRVHQVAQFGLLDTEGGIGDKQLVVGGVGIAPVVDQHVIHRAVVSGVAGSVASSVKIVPPPSEKVYSSVM